MPLATEKDITEELLRRTIAKRKKYKPLQSDINKYIEHILKDDSTGRKLCQEPINKLFHLFIRAAWKERKHALVMLPFGTGKTVQTLPIIAHELGLNRNLRIMLAADVHTTAKQRVKTIESLLLSEENKDVFYDIQADYDRGWSASEGLYLVRDSKAVDPSVRPVGALGATTGPRLDILIGDDIVTLDNAILKNQQEVLIEKISTVLMSRVIDGGRMLFIGTPYLQTDLYAHLQNNPHFATLRCPVSADFSCLEVECTLEDFEVPDTIALPSYANESFMRKRFEEVGYAAWQRGYRLSPVVATETWYHNLDLALEQINPPSVDERSGIIIQGIDLAGKSRKGTAIVTAKATASTLQVIDVEFIAAGIMGRLEAIERAGSMWNVTAQVVESNAQQIEVIDALRDRRVPWKIIPHATTSNKWDAHTGVEMMDVAFANKEVTIACGSSDLSQRNPANVRQLQGIARLIEELRIAPASGKVTVDNKTEITEQQIY
jgi:hypothetical protein